MALEKKDKRTWFYRWSMIAFHLVGLWLLKQLIAILPPFISDWNDKRKEDSKYQVVMTIKVDSLTDLVNEQVDIAKKAIIKYDGQLAESKKEIADIKHQQAIMLETVGTQNATISMMQQRLGNRNFLYYE